MRKLLFLLQSVSLSAQVGIGKNYLALFFGLRVKGIQLGAIVAPQVLFSPF